MTPDLSLDEVRRALIGGLARGLVELRDADAVGYPLVPLDYALALVADGDE